jgi:hypothetical protein
MFQVFCETYSSLQDFGRYQVFCLWVEIVIYRFQFHILNDLAFYTYHAENCSPGSHKKTFTRRVVGVQKHQQIKLALHCASEQHTHLQSIRQS